MLKPRSQKLGKIMACNRSNLEDVRRLFINARNTYSFLDVEAKLCSSKSIVTPYLLICDGFDYICLICNNRSVMCGACFSVTKPLFHRKTAANFNRLIRRFSIDFFFNYFSEIKVLNNDQERRLTSQDIKFISTDCAVQSVDRVCVYPIYMIYLIPNKIRLPTLINGNGVVAMNTDYLISPITLKNMDRVSKCVVALIKNKVIMPPKKQNSFPI